ncbi:hypothetical protein BDZ90DRAFT_97506 [Jaminaea rosea]|uniref:Uncharacterized protein n=1 Tax=Jaminaea rosea TaxID=1569628 RepID=A0A316ULN1_9BASI|nr:hypothetical protein BDZ90DRAFT_97506 [Jaminaea rosea]PWN24833.1 hypothetical protein BDZ90DRAFT_97506 [Jaminaea rosea]
MVLLQCTPSSVNIERISSELTRLPGVLRIDELRIWQLNEHHSIASVKLLLVLPDEKPNVCANPNAQPHPHLYHFFIMPSDVLRRARAILQSWGVEECTVEVEYDTWQQTAQCMIATPPRAASNDSINEARPSGTMMRTSPPRSSEAINGDTGGTERRRSSWRGPRCDSSP